MSEGEKKALAKMRDDLMAAKQLPKDKHGRRLWPGCHVTFEGKPWSVSCISLTNSLTLVRDDDCSSMAFVFGRQVERLEK